MMVEENVGNLMETLEETSLLDGVFRMVEGYAGNLMACLEEVSLQDNGRIY